MSLAGALAGLLLATSDFFALWLWLPEADERLALALALVGWLVPLGLLLAVAVAGLDDLRRRLASRPAGLVWPLLVGSLAWLFARDLLSGPRASTLPGRPALEFLIGVGAALAVFGLDASRSRARAWLARRGRRVGVSLLALALALVLAKLDQTLYPRHYVSAHAALTLAALGAAAVGVTGLLPARFDARLGARASLVTAVAALLALAGTGWWLGGSHDTRALLADPRVGSGRSAFLLLAPLLPSRSSRVSLEGEAAARTAASRRAAARPDEPGPDWSNAHVLIVSVDALRADRLGAYGYRRPVSPRLDRLARESVRFERAWTPTPRSSHALASLHVGLAIHARLERGLPIEAPSLADRARATGRYTAAFYPDAIFTHEGGRLERLRVERFGFERRDGRFLAAEPITDAALDEVDDLVRRGEPPALIWVHYFDVHEPYRETRLGDAPTDRYDGEIANVDRAFGRLLDEARARLARDIVLVITADHGEELGDHGGSYHGGTLFEEQLHVPLIIHGPDVVPGVVSTPVSLLDLAPTLEAALGWPPAMTDGVDLGPWLMGASPERGPIFATETGMEAILDWPSKLIVDARVGTRLFDLALDPRERRSVATSESSTVERLGAELAVWLRAREE